jgi:predicted SnoaL-like aldol condensation-catalyzing enzyme
MMMKSLIGAAALAALLAHPVLAAGNPTIVNCDGNPNLARFLEMDSILFNGPRDGSRAAEFYADPFLSHDSDRGDAEGVQERRPTHMAGIAAGAKATFPDRVLKNDLIACADDLLIVRVIVTGTMTGAMMGMAPTGKSFKTSAIDIYRFKDGKVVERWGNSDGLGMIAQLGLLDAYAKGPGAARAEGAQGQGGR